MLDFRDVFFLAPEIVLTVWGLLVLLVDLGLAPRQDAPPSGDGRSAGWRWSGVALALAGGGCSCRCSSGSTVYGLAVGWLSFAAIDYFSEPDPVSFFGTLVGRPADRLLQHPVHRAPAGPGRLAVDDLVVHRGVGRVLRPHVLGDGRHDAADRLRRAAHALPDARDDDDLPVPEHGLREDEAAVGGGGPQVLRLRIGLLGALPVRAEPALRPDGHDPVRWRSGRRSSLAGGRRDGPGGQRRRGDGDPAHAGRLRVQGRGGAVPPVGARRLRRGPGAGDGLDRDRLEARQLRRADEGVPARAAALVEPVERASWARAGSASSRSSRPSR